MADNLILSGAWLLAALFFLFFNLKLVRHSNCKLITFILIWVSSAFTLYFLFRASFEMI